LFEKKSLILHPVKGILYYKIHFPQKVNKSILTV